MESRITPALPAAARGALWMLGSVSSFTAMAIAAREAGRIHDTFEVMFYRSVIGLVILLAFLALTGRLGQIGRRRLGLMGLRNLFHFAGQNLWIHALVVLPLAQVFALEFTTPIWMLLLSPLILGEAVTRRGIGVAALGFLGILVLTRPFGGGADPALILAALAAVGFALANTLTRALTRTETVISVLFWLHVMQGVMGLVTAGIDGQITAPQAGTILPLLAVGVLGLTGHACLASALSLAPPEKVMPVDYLRLPLVTLAGWWLYDEGVDLWLLAGAGLILLANWLNLPRRRARMPEGPE